MTKLFLDIEASGTEPTKHSILSIGIVISDDEAQDCKKFYVEIKYDELIIVPEAISVNEIEFKDQKDRIPLDEADRRAFDFVRKHYSKDNKAMVIGLNVGEFDLQFISRYMPKLNSLLNRRGVNLNSLIYLISDLKSLDFMQLKTELTEKAAIELEQTNLGLKKHNALYDALFNLKLYSIIKNYFI